MINEIQSKIQHFLNEIKEGKNLKENKNKLISSWKSLEKPDPPSESDVLLFSKKNYKNTNQTVLFLLIHFLEKKGIELKGFLNEITKIIENMGDGMGDGYNMGEGSNIREGYMNEVDNIGFDNKDNDQPNIHPTTSYPTLNHHHTSNHNPALNHHNPNNQLLCFIKNCINDHLDFKNIINDLNNKDYSSLDLFIKKEPVQIPLKFYFSILFFLNSDSPLDQILILLKTVSPLMHELKNDFLFKECKKFLKFIIFKNDHKDLNLKSLFIKEFSRIKFYIDKDFLNKILIVGQSSFNQLKGVNTLNLEYLNNENENILPIEIKLPKGYNYHSLFVCTVLKVLCGEDNPPVVLKCNHVISLQAADILSNFDFHENFKCPYCPEMCNNKEVVKIEL